MNDDRRRYRVLTTLGKGGFGTVYQAELVGEGGFTKIVALKVLNPDVAGIEEVAQRLRDEARVLGLVRHRAIVQVDGLVQLENRWTVVMEYVEGADLKHLIRAEPMPPGPALEVIAEVANALRAAAEQPGPDGRPLCLIHRDLKPSNLTLTERGEVKVLDFGTARANFASREAHTQSLAFGTIDYMAPERLEFVDSPAGDVYALGVILAEMLTGERVGRTSPRPEKHLALRDAVLERVAATGASADLVGYVRDLFAFEAEDRPDIQAVERRARELRMSCGGPWLSDWAATAVPAVRATLGETEPGDLSGMTLIEGSGSRAIPPEPPPAEQDPGTRWVHRDDTPATTAPPPPPPTPSKSSSGGGTRIALGLVGLVFAVGLGAAASYLALDALTDRTPAEVESTPVPEPAVIPEPEPDLDVPTEPAPEPIEPAPSAEPSPRPRPSPRPEPVPTGSWRVSGDVSEVALVRDGKRYGPGRVPVGDYTIEGSFGDRGVLEAGRVTVRAGADIEVSCVAAFARCTTR